MVSFGHFNLTLEIKCCYVQKRRYDIDRLPGPQLEVERKQLKENKACK